MKAGNVRQLMKGEILLIAARGIDELIETGWYVLEGDPDREVIKMWKHQALACVSAIMGSDHLYTQDFQKFVVDERKRSLLAGAGLLLAVREHILDSGQNNGAFLPGWSGTKS